MMLGCASLYMMIIQSWEMPLVYHKWFLGNAAKQLNQKDHTHTDVQTDKGKSIYPFHIRGRGKTKW
jgi:hypothetical protein